MELAKILKWFENFGYRYINNTLCMVDINKMQNDPDYAKKMFFFYWAFARAGATNEMKIATIKILHSPIGKKSPEEYFKQFFKVKPNKDNNPEKGLNRNNNPAMDQKFNEVNICDTVDILNKHKIQKAFNSIALKGIGHKIRSFFLRDIAFLLGMNGLTKEDYIFLNPLDFWVEETIKALNIEDIQIDLPRGFLSEVRLSREKYKISMRLIESCLKSDISPLQTNMGMWYFCSRYVANYGRLHDILKENSIQKLEDEVKLMGIYGDFKTIIE